MADQPSAGPGDRGPAEVAETEVARSRSVGVVAALAVAVIAALFWSLSRPTGDDVPATTNPTTSPTTALAALATFVPRNDGAATVRGAAVHQRFVDAGAPPLLGHTSGLSLLFASTDGDLHVLDLDTGSTTSHPSAGRPAVVIGSWLIVHHPDGPTRAVPLTDLGADGIHLAGPEVDGAATALGPAGAEVWLLRPSLRPTRHVWRLVSVDTASTIGEVEAALRSPSPWPWPWPGETGGPAVTSSPGGGVWALDAVGRYDQVAAGSLVAVGEAHVLVQTCSQPTVCVLEWLDRDTWSPIPRATPGESIAGPALLAGGDRLLFYVGVDGPRLFDVANDRTVAFGEWSPWHLAASADGRYVAHTLGRPVIHDLDRGRSHRLELPDRPAHSPPLLVPSALLRSGEVVAATDG